MVSRRVGPYYRDAAKHYAGLLGRALGWTAHRLGVGDRATDLAVKVLRALDPDHPVLAAYDARQASKARHPSVAPEEPPRPDQRLRLMPSLGYCGRPLRGHGASEGDSQL